MWASTVPRHLHVLRSQKLSSPDRLPKPAMMRNRACGDHRTVFLGASPKLYTSSHLVLKITALDGE